MKTPSGQQGKLDLGSSFGSASTDIIGFPGDSCSLSRARLDAMRAASQKHDQQSLCEGV